MVTIAISLITLDILIMLTGNNNKKKKHLDRKFNPFKWNNNDKCILYGNFSIQNKKVKTLTVGIKLMIIFFFFLVRKKWPNEVEHI